MHSESQWRYRAYREGLRLVKNNQSAPAYEQYGPYALVDRSTNRVVRGNLGPRDVELALCDEAAETSSSVTATC